MEHYDKLFLVLGVIGLIWVFVLIGSLISLIKRKDMILPAKIFWGIVIFSAPFVGLLFYFFLTADRKRRTQVVK